MGHFIGKGIIRKLGRKIDGLEIRAPWNDQLHELLKELYSEEEDEAIRSRLQALGYLDQS